MRPGGRSRHRGLVPVLDPFPDLDMLRFALFASLVLAAGSCANVDPDVDTPGNGARLDADTVEPDAGAGVRDAGADSATSADAVAADAASVDADADTGPAPLSRLRAEGTALVDATGQQVQLRGVNLGGWMFHETWITAVDYPLWGRAWEATVRMGYGDIADAVIQGNGPGDDAAWLESYLENLRQAAGVEAAQAVEQAVAAAPSIYDDSDLPLRRLLESRFGIEGRDALLDTFHKSWITADDIAMIADLGFNTVRIPIGYRSLLAVSDSAPLTELVYNEAALQRIDDLLDACAEHGVYAVIDVQESPGGHNDYSGPARLYDDERSLAQTTELWLTLSRRYRDRDEVAMYSLLAEPFGAPGAAERDRVYDVLIDAIRADGDDHLLVVHDGFFGMSSLPDAQARAALGWEGVVYSTHQFEWGLDSLEDYEALLAFTEPGWVAAWSEQDVPWYMGSFSTMVDAPWAWEAAALLRETYERHGWGWSVWTWRRIDDPLEVRLFGASTAWGVVGRLDDADGFRRPDVYLDDFETLQAGFAAYHDLSRRPNEGLLGALLP